MPGPSRKPDWARQRRHKRRTLPLMARCASCGTPLDVPETPGIAYVCSVECRDALEGADA